MKDKYLIGALMILIPVNVVLTYRNVKNWKDDHIADSGKLVEIWNVLPENENKRVMMTVTGYSSVEGCDDRECIMANGKRAEIGNVACSRKYKLGTRMKIEDRVYVCGDRLSMKYDSRVDMFMGNGIEGYERARQWGVRNLEVEIIN